MPEFIVRKLDVPLLWIVTLSILTLKQRCRRLL